MKKAIVFPHLIFRDNDAIESGIASMRYMREEVARRLAKLYADLAAWYVEPLTVESFIGFVFSGNYEARLMDLYRIKHNIPDEIRHEKIKDIYRIPDYSRIIIDAGHFFKMSKAELSSYFDEAGKITPAPLTAEEKEGIVSRHCFYAHNQMQMNMYNAVEQLCEAVNIINEDVHFTHSGNKIEAAAVFQLWPELRRYITVNQPRQQNKKWLSVNFAAFGR